MTRHVRRRIILRFLTQLRGVQIASSTLRGFASKVRTGLGPGQYHLAVAGGYEVEALDLNRSTVGSKSKSVHPPVRTDSYQYSLCVINSDGNKAICRLRRPDSLPAVARRCADVQTPG
jgi:hypothetical protein